MNDEDKEYIRELKQLQEIIAESHADYLAGRSLDIDEVRKQFE